MLIHSGYLLLYFLCFYHTSLVVIVAVFTRPCIEGYIPFPAHSFTTIDLSTTSTGGGGDYDCISASKALHISMEYLEKNMPLFDEINRISLGFESDYSMSNSGGSSNRNSDIKSVESMNNNIKNEVFFSVNAISEKNRIDGLVSMGTNHSLEMRNKYRWAADVPLHIYLEYVLPYGIVNEARNDWRPILSEVVSSVLDVMKDLDDYILEDIILYINDNLWEGRFCRNIVFKGQMTPLVYDTMSILAYGYASCTGLSVFLINALRSVGIPARLAGTPGWKGDPQNGIKNAIIPSYICHHLLLCRYLDLNR